MTTRLAGLALTMALLVTAPAAQTNEARVLLEAARRIETVDGNLPAAIAKYQEIVDRYEKTDRAAAAQALVRIGECARLAANDGRARAAFERIIREFSDQEEAATLARVRLANGQASPKESQMPRLICEDCGQLFSSISSDGRLMAFADQETGNLAVRDLVTGKVTSLVSSDADSEWILSASLSRDARQIAYTVAIKGEPTQLRVVANAAGAKPRVLASNPEFQTEWPIDWTPDGRAILAWTLKSDKTWQLVWVSTVDGATRTLKSLGWKVSDPVKTASLSPDGRYVAYSALPSDPGKPTPSDVGNRHIFVLPHDGAGAEHIIAAGAATNESPMWSADGSHLIYLSDVSGTQDLWAARVDKGRLVGAPLLIRKNVGDAVSLGMTASGTYHYYEGRRGILRSTVVSLAGAGAQARDSQSVIGAEPTWAPDGQSVAVYRPARSGQGSDVVVRSLATGEERAYSRAGIQSYPALWFPDGKSLLVVGPDQSESFWFRLDLSTGDFKKLQRNRGDRERWTHVNIKTLAPDGKTLYFGTYMNATDPVLDRIVALNLETGAYHDVFRLPLSTESLPRAAQQFSLAVSPDGRLLALHFVDRAAQKTRLAVVGVDGTGYREIAADTRGEWLRNKLAWSSDGRFIYFTEPGAKNEHGDEMHRVMRVAVAGGSMEWTGLEIDRLDAFDISPDGRRLAYSTLRPEGAAEMHWTLEVGSMLETIRGSRTR